MKRPSNRRPSTARLTVTLLLGVSLLGANTLTAQRTHLPGSGTSLQQTANLEGKVRTDDGVTLLSSVTVRLETAQGELAGEQPANSNGMFEFANLEKRVYRLTVKAEGYQTYEQILDLGRAGGKLIVSVQLTPLSKVRQATPVLPALTDERAPKEARKNYETGARALKDKNLNEARAGFQKAVEEFPCYARAQIDLGLVLGAQHDYPGAEKALSKAIECDPGFLDAYTQLGQLFNSQRKFKESVAVLQNGLRLAPRAWQFYYQLAAAHYGLEQYHQAEEEFLKVQSLDPAPPAEIHVKLADLYLKLSEYAKAYAQMQEYLRAEPDGRFAAKIKNIMRQMESAGVLNAAQSKSPELPASKP